MLSRRTCRNFAPQSIDRAVIDGLLAQAIHAPNTGNMQLYSVIVTTSREGLDALAPLHFNQPATKAPAMLTFCADVRRFSRWCALSDAQAGFDNLQGLTTAVLDTVAFTQQFCVAAESAGLGTCYLGTTTYNAPGIIKALGLPKLVVPVTTIALGRPAELKPEEGRLPVAAVTHYEAYDDPNDDTLLGLYAEKEARDDSRAFVAENNKQTLAQVFAEVRYPGKMMRDFSSVWADALRAQGFDI